jgi:hypothetical protein
MDSGSRSVLYYVGVSWLRCSRGAKSLCDFELRNWTVLGKEGKAVSRAMISWIDMRLCVWLWRTERNLISMYKEWFASSLKCLRKQQLPRGSFDWGNCILPSNSGTVWQDDSMTEGGHTGDKKFSNNRGVWHALILSHMNQSTVETALLVGCISTVYWSH